MAVRRVVLVAIACGLCALAVAQEEDVAPGEATESTDEEEKGKDGKSRKETASQYSYCAADNCYDLLGVKKETGLIKIKREYRKLAALWHPDKNPNKPRAQEVFQKYANAYAVLSDTEMRANYDYLLEHPYEFPMHFLRYGSGKYAPKSDLRTVLLLVLLGISAVQYLIQGQRRANVIKDIKGTRQYQERLKILMGEVSGVGTALAKPRSGSAKSTKKDSSKDSKTMGETKAAAEAKFLEEIAADLPSEPNIHDTLAFQVFCLPLTGSKALYANSVWTLKFTLLRQEYGDEEKAYLTSKAVGFTSAEWARLSTEEQGAWLEKELWIAENKAEFDAEEEGAKAGARSTKEKRALRLRKKGITATPVMD